MAIEETTPEVTLETPQEPALEATPKTVSEQSYSLAELKENAMTIFGVQPEVIAGALHGNAKQEFKVSELKGLVTKFLKKKVE